MLMCWANHTIASSQCPVPRIHAHDFAAQLICVAVFCGFIALVTLCDKFHGHWIVARHPWSVFAAVGAWSIIRVFTCAALVAGRATEPWLLTIIIIEIDIIVAHRIQ